MRMERLIFTLVSVMFALHLTTAIATSDVREKDDFGTYSPKCSGDQEYIQKGEWVYRYNEWTLSLTPTTCGRQINATQTPNMFYEIVKKFAGSPYWANTRGMINQLTCHLVIARNKPEWNLDPWRPYVGHDRSVAEGCNATTPDPDSVFH